MPLIPVAAAPPPVTVAYYANACVEPETGDVGGYQLAFIQQGGKVSVQFRFSDGKLLPAVVAKGLRYDEASGAIAFSLQTTQRVTFTGKLTSAAVIGQLVEGKADPYTIRLTRVARVLERPDACPALKADPRKP